MRKWGPAFVGYAAQLNSFTSDPSFPKRRDSKMVKEALRWTSSSGQELGQDFKPVRYDPCEEAGCNAAVVSDPRYNQLSSWRTTGRPQFDAWQRQVFSSSPLLFPCGGYRIPCMISFSRWTLTLTYDLDEFSPFLHIIPVKSSEY
jgi:hypothetical protein